MTNKIPVSKRLKEARIASGLSQKQLGIQAGIDPFSASPRINQYEVGKHTPDYLTLKNIGKVLGCPVSYFYADDDELAYMIIKFITLRKSNKIKIIKTIDAIQNQI